jgi:hypothetical protein
MGCQLTEVCCLKHSSTEWVTLLEDLRQDVAALLNGVDHLERENLELRMQAGSWTLGISGGSQPTGARATRPCHRIFQKQWLFL